MMLADNQTIEQLIQAARQALQEGKYRQARRAAEQATQVAPHMEQPWLLRAVLSSPRAAEYFFGRALSLNPESEYAKAGLVWLQQKTTHKGERTPTLVNVVFPELVAAKEQSTLTKRDPMFFILLFTLTLAVLATLGFSVKWIDKTNPIDIAHQFAMTTLTALGNQPTETSSPSPSLTWTAPPTSTIAASRTSTQTPSPIPSKTVTPLPSASHTPQPTETRDPTATKPAPTREVQSTYTIKPGDTLSAIAVRFGISVSNLMNANHISNASKIRAGQVLTIPGTRAGSSQPQAPTSGPNPSNDGKLILIDISEQHLYAYEKDTLIFSFVASTGIGNSTRIGTFKVLDKIPNAYSNAFNIWMPYWMGIYYSGTLENGIHGLPKLWNGVELWGSLLGRPATYGCIETKTSEAKLLYEWAEIGTKVTIRP